MQTKDADLLGIETAQCTPINPERKTLKEWKTIFGKYSKF
jgi:hypothetical protein